MLLGLDVLVLVVFVLKSERQKSTRMDSFVLFFFFQAGDGIRCLVRSRGLGDVYERRGMAP